jgi:signal transduction histidine kinase
MGLAAQDTHDYKKSQEYLTLRDSVHHAFNDGDSVRFFGHMNRLKEYLLKQNDPHTYYTQRCNEIVFLLNRDRILEAYKMATLLSKELTEKRLDKEMYMAVNMMGHIYRVSGNKEEAKKCFWDVIDRMEKAGYAESIPPIYMNIVNITMNDDPEEALQLIDKALAIARESAPERVFDIESRRTLMYHHLGDKEQFLKGYEKYREGVAQGLSSVHGRKIEIYYQALMGNIDEAVRLAAQTEDDPYETQADILAGAGRWQEAYNALKLGAAESDSINSVILAGSMQDIQNELRLYDARRHAARLWLYGLIVVTVLLLALVVALVYIVQSRRRHLSQLRKAYQRVLEADQMKTDFIRNVSHEIRTPLNIISGFAQVLGMPDYEGSQAERQQIANTVKHNTELITKMINEVLELGRGKNDDTVGEQQTLHCNDVIRRIITLFCLQTECEEQLLEHDTELSDDFTFTVNERMLQSLVKPLLENAYNNIPAGKGHIIIRTKKDDTTLFISVEDNGKGIAAKDAERVFGRFVKLDTFKEGLGLGLTLSRAIARRMGGDVRLDTTFRGPGARFIVTLPIKNYIIK